MREPEGAVGINELAQGSAVEVERLNDAPLGVLDRSIHVLGRQVDKFRGEIGRPGRTIRSNVDGASVGRRGAESTHVACVKVVFKDLRADLRQIWNRPAR